MFSIQGTDFDTFRKAVQDKAWEVGFKIGQTTTCFTKVNALKHFANDTKNKVKNGYFYCRGRRKECPFSIYFKYDLNHKVYVVLKATDYHNHELNPNTTQGGKQNNSETDLVKSNYEVDFTATVIPLFESDDRRYIEIISAAEVLECDLLQNTYSDTLLNKVKDICSRIVNIKNNFTRSSILYHTQNIIGKFISILMFHTYSNKQIFLQLEEIHSLVGTHAKIISLETYLIGFIDFIKLFDDFTLNIAIQFQLNQLKEHLKTVELGFTILGSFSFRNGILRKSFDGIKYVLKNIESRVYELGILQTTSNILNLPTIHENEINTKRANLETYFTNLSTAYDDEDNYRESIIKSTRDIQKYAKKAIYKAQENKLDEALQLINKCIELLNQIKHNDNNEMLLYSIHQYTCCIEELVEAILFLNWNIYHSETFTVTQLNVYGTSLILTFQSIKSILNVSISINIYLGGISDFTGEIGRIGVKAATKRDMIKIKSVISTMETCQNTLMKLFKRKKPRKYQEKKLKQMDINLKKMKNILYEQIIFNKKSHLMSSMNSIMALQVPNQGSSQSENPIETPSKRPRIENLGSGLAGDSNTTQ